MIHPSFSMIFIQFESFVCTFFAQPVQRIQLETGPGAQASGVGELLLLLCFKRASPLSQSALFPVQI